MPTGRKKKRSVVEASSVALLALIRKGFFIYFYSAKFWTTKGVQKS